MLFSLCCGNDLPSHGGLAAPVDGVLAADDGHRAGRPRSPGPCCSGSGAAFAEPYGTRFGFGYLTWWRIATAGHLLQGSDTSLRTIAARVGYTSEFALNRAFKREYGTTPGNYRRQCGSGARGDLATAPSAM
ncbi:helix-turn-helix domain-containing protein [Streptomyces asiaticus]